MERQTHLRNILDPGQLDRKITIETPTETANTFGELEPTWGTLATVWAKVEEGSGGGEKESYSAGRETAFFPVTFTIRYRADLTEKMRITFEGRVFDIISIAEISRKRFTQILTQIRQ